MDWVKQLNEVNADDLAAVELRLTQLNDEATALLALKAVFAAKLGVKPEPAQAPAKAKVLPKNAVAADITIAKTGPHTSAYRREAARFLMQNGPTKPSVICLRCQIPTKGNEFVFNHPWFTRTDDGIELTHEGKKAATTAA